jgi:competence protein ComEC
LSTNFLNLGLVVLGVGLLTFALIRGFQTRFAIVGILAVATVIGVQLVPRVFHFGWPIRDWFIVSCDVGQGDATVIRSDNQIAVIDVGPDPGLIDQCLQRLSIRQIDLLVLTHFDMDHVGGLSGLERGRSIQETLLSSFPDTRFTAVQDSAHLQRVSQLVEFPKEGDHGVLGSFQWSVISSLGNQGRSANESSLGIRFESNSTVIYTLADLNETAQCRIAPLTVESSKLTIVKVSHHGSADQCQAFYQAINPDVALISVGKNNRYGHPTQKLLGILNRIGSYILRTDQQGSIALAINQGKLESSVSGAR